MSFASSLMRSFMLRDTYHEKLKELELELKPAELRGETDCVMCGYCCTRRACVPTPDEVPIIAEHLGLTVEQLIQRHMVSDKVGGHSMFLRFINDKQNDIAGSFLPANRSWDVGYCTLFDTLTRRCRIHAVKPRQAKESGAQCMFTDGALVFSAEAEWSDGDVKRLAPGLDLEEATDW